MRVWLYIGMRYGYGLRRAFARALRKEMDGLATGRFCMRGWDLHGRDTPVDGLMYAWLGSAWEDDTRADGILRAWRENVRIRNSMH